jgi:hypothetical protein
VNICSLLSTDTMLIMIISSSSSRSSSLAITGIIRGSSQRLEKTGHLCIALLSSPGRSPRASIAMSMRRPSQPAQLFHRRTPALGPRSKKPLDRVTMWGKSSSPPCPATATSAQVPLERPRPSPGPLRRGSAMEPLSARRAPRARARASFPNFPPPNEHKT